MRGAAHPYLDHPGPIAFAHRGGPAGGPENSLLAIDAALALGYRYVETDVQATADGVLVAFHDRTLERMTDRVGMLARLPFREVTAARLAGGERIPRFEEILGTWPELRVNIEPKHDAAVGPLVEVIRRLDAVDRVCVGSFSHRRTVRVRAALGPRLCTSATPREVAALRAAAWSLPAALIRRAVPGAACVQVPVRAGRIPLVDRRFLATAHRLGLPVHVWTVNEEPEMHRLLDLGVDGLMSDVPAVLRSVLEARDQWR